MQPEQRKLRARTGDLSAYQRSVWAQAFPEEVGWVNDTGRGGVPPWIAATLCDIVDEGQG